MQERFDRILFLIWHKIVKDFDEMHDRNKGGKKQRNKKSFSILDSQPPGSLNTLHRQKFTLSKHTETSAGSPTWLKIQENQMLVLISKKRIHFMIKQYAFYLPLNEEPGLYVKEKSEYVCNTNLKTEKGKKTKGKCEMEYDIVYSFSYVIMNESLFL